MDTYINIKEGPTHPTILYVHEDDPFLSSCVTKVNKGVGAETRACG